MFNRSERGFTIFNMFYQKMDTNYFVRHMQKRHCVSVLTFKTMVNVLGEYKLCFNELGTYWEVLVN